MSRQVPALIQSAAAGASRASKAPLPSKTALRRAPIAEIVQQLKHGHGSVRLPEDVKSLEVRYYRKATHDGIRTFIARYAPQLAYANPDLPFNINRLGQSLHPTDPILKSPSSEETSATSADGPRPPSQSSDVVDSSPTDGASSGDVTSPSVKIPTNPHPSSPTRSRVQLRKRNPVVLIKEDGTEVRYNDKIDSEFIIGFHSKEPETLTIGHESAASILRRIYDTLGVQAPGELGQMSGPKSLEAPPAVEQPIDEQRAVVDDILDDTTVRHETVYVS